MQRERVAVIAMSAVLLHASLAIAAPSTVLYTLGAPSGVQYFDLNPEAGFANYGQTIGAGALVGVGNSNPSRALFWNAANPGSVDLTPTGANTAFALGTDGTYQVGVVNNVNATIWSGSAQSAHTLIGLGGTYSTAYGISSGQIVGYATDAQNNQDAVLWTSASASPTSLNPFNPLQTSTSSVAFGTDGVHQVGYLAAQNTHAYLWTGTAASAVDLNPNGATNSTAYSVGGGVEVGWADGPGTQAYMWNGSSASAVKLGTSGVSSEALGTNGTYEVGYAATGPQGQYHATLWQGSAASAVDLNAFLPASFQSGTNEQSFAVSVSGDTIYGWGQGTNGIQALSWSIAEVTALPGDANLDGKVDLNDLNVVLNHLGLSSTQRADGNFDGAATIDLNDLNEVLNNLGASKQAAALMPGAAPEPASLAIVGAGTLVLMLRRSVPTLPK